jgi:hypothetical protein
MVGTTLELCSLAKILELGFQRVTRDFEEWSALADDFRTLLVSGSGEHGLSES